MPIVHTLDEIKVLDKEDKIINETEETVELEENLEITNVVEEETPAPVKKSKYEKRMQNQRNRKNK